MYKNIYIIDLYDNNNNFKKTITANFNYNFFKNLFKNKINMIITLLNTSKSGYLEGYKKYYFKDSPKRKVLLIPPEKHIGYNH